MTTQELKQYIDKVLGNSIRCLLPSYWWKRLFNQVADRIDEAEQFASELIETKVNEVKMPIVESENALKKLDVENGSLASVLGFKSKERSLRELYQLSFGDIIREDLSRCTDIEDIIIKYPSVFPIMEGIFVAMFSDGDTRYFTIVFGVKNNVNYVIVDTRDGTELPLYVNGVYYQEGHDYIREELSSYQYKYVFAMDPLGNIGSLVDYDIIDQFITCIATLPTANVYVKGNTWERLAKESDLEGIEGGSGSAEIKEEMDALKAEVDALNEKSKVVRVYATIGKEGSLDNVLLTEEYKERNNEIYERVANGEVLFADIYGGYDYAEDQYYTGTRYFNALKGTLVGNRVVFRIENNDRNESSVTQIEISAGGNAWIYHSFMADKAYVDNAIASAITNTLNTEV